MRKHLRIFQHQCHPPSQLPPPSHGPVLQFLLVCLFTSRSQHQWMPLLFATLPIFTPMKYISFYRTLMIHVALLSLYYQTAHRVSFSCFSSFILFLCFLPFLLTALNHSVISYAHRKGGHRGCRDGSVATSTCCSCRGSQKPYDRSLVFGNSSSRGSCWVQQGCVLETWLGAVREWRKDRLV